MEIDIGTPGVRNEPDYWGETGTDRFYDFDPGRQNGHIILAREFTRALVLARFGPTGGFANIGQGATSIDLGGTYYRLQADNTTGPAISSIVLGQSEGAILLKEPLNK